MSLEDLTNLKVDAVYGASKFLQKAAHVPASVTIITAEQIRNYGYRTLADALRAVRGFYVTYDRNYSYVGVRGLASPGDYNARILFLLDGHRLNDNIFDGAYVATEFPVGMDLIERVEIIRGPSSSVYGTGAFFAVVNVITKRGRDLGSTEVSGSAGSWNSYKGRLSFGKRYDSDLETLLSGAFYNSEGHSRLFFPEFQSPPTNNGFAANADGDRSYDLFAHVIYRNLNIHVVHGSRTKQIPTASFGTVFNDPRTKTTDARGYLEGQYHRTFGTWDLLGRISYDWYNYRGVYIYDYARTGPPFTENIDLADGTWLDLQADVSRMFGERHQITLGTEFRQDLRQHQANYDREPYALYLEDDHHARVGALYFQDDVSIRKDLAVVAGVRSDWHQKSGITLSPRLGLLFNLTPATNATLLFSTAFRAPNSYENVYVSSTSNSANSSLRPEKIRSLELDLERHFGRRLYIAASGFLNRIDRFIEQETDPLTGGLLYTNSQPWDSKGIELELAAQWVNRLEARVSHTFQDSRQLQTRDVLTNSPRQLSKINLSIPLLRQGLLAGIEGQYTSSRRTVSQTDLGGFFVINLTLFARNLRQGLDLSASVYNLFDKRYADSGGLEHLQTSIPQDGRSFRLKLSYRVPSGP